MGLGKAFATAPHVDFCHGLPERRWRRCKLCAAVSGKPESPARDRAARRGTPFGPRVCAVWSVGVGDVFGSGFGLTNAKTGHAKVTSFGVILGLRVEQGHSHLTFDVTCALPGALLGALGGYGQGLVASGGSAPRSAHLLTVAAVNLALAREVPLPSAADDPPLAGILAQLQVLVSREDKRGACARCCLSIHSSACARRVHGLAPQLAHVPYRLLSPKPAATLRILGLDRQA
jgi:hypothetical protein